jgi:AraC-like DNA-binding protein
MEWLNRMNTALEYMENNLDGDISLEKASQIALLSQYQFQRMFSYMAGLPLSVYLRQRRLTKAAFDLQNGDKVIDVSLRYGYARRNHRQASCRIKTHNRRIRGEWQRWIKYSSQFLI